MSKSHSQIEQTMNKLIAKAEARNLVPLHFAFHVDTLKAFEDENPPTYRDLPLYFDIDIGENEVIMFAEDLNTAVIHQFLVDLGTG